jgi:hypothetical protein
LIETAQAAHLTGHPNCRQAAIVVVAADQTADREDTVFIVAIIDAITMCAEPAPPAKRMLVDEAALKNRTLSGSLGGAPPLNL